MSEENKIAPVATGGAPKERSLAQLAKLEKLRRLKQERMRYYVPTGVGEEFIRLVGSDDYFVTLFSAANGIGKTCIGANTFANFLFPKDQHGRKYNEWFNSPLFTKWPYPKRARIITDPTTVTSAIIPELKMWFPLGRYKIDKKGKNYEYYWTTDTGWEFEIMTYDQDPKEFESATLGLVWLDEPPPESIYKGTVARLRRGGLIYITATPLTGSAWIYDQVISNPNREKGRRTYLEADVESACIQHGVRGFLEHDHIEQMIAEYSEDEKQARIYGKFQHLIGLVYKQWNRKVHVVRPFNINLRDYTVYQALDPHPRNEDAVLWVAVDKYGQKFVIDELFHKSQGGVKELAERIKQKDSQYRVELRIADPKAFEDDQHHEKNLATRLGEHGLNYIPATKKRTASDRRIGDALDYQIVGNEFIVTPELYVFDTCNRFIFEIEHWRWDEWTGKAVDKHNKKETKVDKDDHMLENLGRILIREPRFTNYHEASDSIDAGESGVLHSKLDPYS
jgi:phage terminase large subunit-like protein